NAQCSDLSMGKRDARSAIPLHRNRLPRRARWPRYKVVHVHRPATISVLKARGIQTRASGFRRADLLEGPGITHPESGAVPGGFEFVRFVEETGATPHIHHDASQRDVHWYRARNLMKWGALTKRNFLIRTRVSFN